MKRLQPTAAPVSSYITPAIRQPEQAQMGPAPQAPNAGPSGTAQISDAALRLSQVVGSFIQPVLQAEVANARSSGATDAASELEGLDPLAKKEALRQEALALKKINPYLSPVQYARRVSRIEVMTDNAAYSIRGKIVAALPQLTSVDAEEGALENLIDESIAEFGLTGIAARHMSLQRGSLLNQYGERVALARADNLQKSAQQAQVNRGSIAADNFFDTDADIETFAADIKSADGRYYEEYGISAKPEILQGILATFGQRIGIASRNDDSEEIERLIGLLEPVLDRNIFNEDQSLALEAQLARAETIAASIVEDPHKAAQKAADQQRDMQSHFWEVLGEAEAAGKMAFVTQDSLSEEMRSYAEAQGYDKGVSFKFNHERVGPHFSNRHDQSDGPQKERAYQQANEVVLQYQQGLLTQDETTAMIAAVPHLSPQAAVQLISTVDAFTSRRNSQTAQIRQKARTPVAKGIARFGNRADLAFDGREGDRDAFLVGLEADTTTYLENQFLQTDLDNSQLDAWMAERSKELSSAFTDSEDGTIDLDTDSPHYDFLLPYAQEINTHLRKQRTTSQAIAGAGEGRVGRDVTRILNALDVGLEQAASESGSFGADVLTRGSTLLSPSRTNKHSVQPDGVYLRNHAPAAMIATSGGRRLNREISYSDELGEIDRAATQDLLAYIALTGRTQGYSAEFLSPINHPEAMGVFGNPKTFENAAKDWLREGRGTDDVSIEAEAATRFFDLAARKFPAEEFPFERNEDGITDFLTAQMNVYAPFAGVYFKELDTK